MSGCWDPNNFDGVDFQVPAHEIALSSGCTSNMFGPNIASPFLHRHSTIRKKKSNCVPRRYIYSTYSSLKQSQATKTRQIWNMMIGRLQVKKKLRSKVLFRSVSSAEVQFKYHHHFERKWKYPVGYRTVLEVDIIPDIYCLQTWVSNWWFFTTSTWGFAPGSTCPNLFIFCWWRHRSVGPRIAASVSSPNHQAFSTKKRWRKRNLEKRSGGKLKSLLIWVFPKIMVPPNHPI